MTLSSTTWPTSTRTHNSITLYVVANAAVAKIGLVRDAAVVKLCRVVSGDSAKTQSAAAAGPWLDLAPSFFALVQTAFVLPVGLYQGLQRYRLRQRHAEKDATGLPLRHLHIFTSSTP